MKKIFTLLFALAVTSVSLPAFSADSTAYGGFVEYNKTSGVYTDMVVNGTLRSQASTEVTATGDTLTATESGKVFVNTYTGTYVVYNLPTAAANLKYKFIDGSSTGTEIRVNPESADKIYYSTCGVGDRIDSAGASSDSVELIGGTNAWYVSSMLGTWTDGE